MKHSLTGREKNLIILAFVTAFCALFVSNLIIPSWADYKQNIAVLEERTLSLARLKDAQKAIENSGQDLEQVKADLAKLQKQLPGRPESAELLYYLQLAAEKSGVALERFEVENPGAADNGQASGDGLVRFASRVGVTGTYGQILNFLKQTEELLRMTHNRSVTINELKERKILEGIIQFDTFVTRYANMELNGESDIPKAATGRQSLFKY